MSVLDLQGMQLGDATKAHHSKGSHAGGGGGGGKAPHSSYSLTLCFGVV